MAHDIGFAPLTGALIRRASASFDDSDREADDDGVPRAAAGWRDDLRLFAITWAAGFLFFLIFLA